MARYVITGGAGFIGSHLCERLLAGGHAVRVIDDLSTGSRHNLPASIELIVADAADPAIVGKAVEQVDGIFHLAATASIERSHEHWVEAHRVNQTAAVVVLDAARLAGRIPVVLASSAAVYGDSDDLPLRETAVPRPVSAYGADKLGCELHARVAWIVHGVPTAALRLFNVFGPRQDAGSPYSGVIAIFADRIRRGEAPIVYGDGQQTRDFIYVGDVTQHLEAAMNSLASKPRSLICNVCTGRAVTIQALAHHIGDVLGHPGFRVKFAPPRTGDLRHSCGDPHRAMHELNVRPEIALHCGLSALLRADGG
jgi:UDP-glucose 4-epimerase